jgi:hypothetical protein
MKQDEDGQMREEEIILEAVRREGQHWLAELSFRGKTYEMAVASDSAGCMRPASRSPFALTLEGLEVCVLVERITAGEPLEMPRSVVAGETVSSLLSVHDSDWNDWSTVPSLKEVWLESVEKTGDTRWAARLSLDGDAETYGLEILSGPTLRELRGPKTPSFYEYTYDLTRLLMRMQNGERFALPFRLRPRWPTPPEPPSLER